MSLAESNDPDFVSLLTALVNSKRVCDRLGLGHSIEADDGGAMAEEGRTSVASEQNAQAGCRADCVLYLRSTAR